MGVHAGSPLMVEWHQASAEELQLPELRTIDEVAGVFGDAGFDVAAARPNIGFVPASGHTSTEGAGTFSRWIEYYSDDKLLLRCRRPPLTAG